MQFGPNGAPWNNPNFPFGPNGNPFTNFQAPQTMRDRSDVHGSQDPEHEADEQSALLGHSDRRGRRKSMKQKRRWARFGCCCKPSTIVNIVLGMMVIGLIVLLARLARDATSADPDLAKDDGDGGKDHGHNDHGHNGGSSTTSPDKTVPTQTPPTTSSPTTPITSPSNDPRLPPHKERDGCMLRYFSGRSVSFAFTDPTNFTFVENLELAPFMTSGISGNIWISAAPVEQQDPIRVLFSTASNEDWRIGDMNFRYHYTGDAYSEIMFPDKLPDHIKAPSKNPCLDISVGIYLKDHIQLDLLNISTKHLNIQTGQGPSGWSHYMIVSESWKLATTFFTSVAGTINSLWWSGRTTIIRTQSGAITGRYGLGDLLSMTSQSGRIDTSLLPYPVNPEDPKPAALQAISHSGSIKVLLPDPSDEKVPERDYQTSVSSWSGSLHGQYFFTSQASFKSNSGSIDATVWPRINKTDHSVLETEGGSGSTTLKIKPPPDDVVLGKLRSRHTSRSGSLHLAYPGSWEGSFTGESTSGSIDVDGDGVETWDTDMGYSGHYVVGHKGTGVSRLKFETTSGSTKLRIG
jgi:hypothetical protein